MVHRPHRTLLDKIVTLGSWVVAGAIFLSVGWFAMEPEDPLGAVTVLTRDGGLLVLLQAAALAGVAAAIATVIAGRYLADVGTFAAAVGLAAVSLRGGTAGTLLVHFADSTTSFERQLALGLALEAIGWFAVMLLAMGVSALVMRWMFANPEGEGLNPDDVRVVAARTLTAYDAPRVGSRLFGVPAERQTRPVDGVKHLVITLVAGVLYMSILSAGLSNRSIQHGQVCFVVAAAVYLASYTAYRFVPVHSAFWSILAVPLIALAGYTWAGIRPAVAGLPPNLPSSHFLRVLPIQYISVGTAAALTMFWYTYKPIPHPKGRRQSGRSSTRGRG